MSTIPEDWQWRCFDCEAGGTGNEAKVRGDSTLHLLTTSHSVTGSAVEPEPPEVTFWGKLKRLIGRQ